MKAAEAKALPERVAHLWDDVHGTRTTMGLAQRVQDLLRIVTAQHDALTELRQQVGRLQDDLAAIHDRFGPT